MQNIRLVNTLDSRDIPLSIPVGEGIQQQKK